MVTVLGTVSKVDPTGPTAGSVRAWQPFDTSVQPGTTGEVKMTFAVPAVIVWLLSVEAVKVALAPAPMSAMAPTPIAPTMKNLRVRAIRVFFQIRDER
jgi:hypothetical protein